MNDHIRWAKAAARARLNRVKTLAAHIADTTSEDKLVMSELRLATQELVQCVHEFNAYTNCLQELTKL